MQRRLTGIRKRIRAALTDVHATRSELNELREQVSGIAALLRNDTAPRDTLASQPRVTDGRRSEDELREAIALLSTQVGRMLLEQHRAMDALQVLFAQEPDNRRRLHALRQSEDYERAYLESEPLVSVVIPTYLSFETLRDRSIPSVLAQSYKNWEIVVIGDSAPTETGDVIAELNDPRIRYENQPMRGPYPEDEYDAWLVAGVPPFNAGMRAARGRWIAPLADDDALRPDALAHLVSEAQEHRHELCYAKLLLRGRDGRVEVLGDYPPRLSPTGISFGMQGSIFHSGVRFFEQEIADVIFRTPSDWSMIRRMLRAGVRFGFLDEITCDYFPSYRGEDAPEGKPLR